MRLFHLGSVGFGFLIFGCGTQPDDTGTNAGESGGSASAGKGGAVSGSGGASGGSSAGGAGASSGGSGTAGSAGGNAGAGNAGSSSAGSGGAAPHTVAPCDALGDSGIWESVVPAEVHLDPNYDVPTGSNFGVHSMVIDPTNTANVYLGTSSQGIYKSTDCAATWVKINTGTLADTMNGGRQWTFVIDPVNSQNLYTNAGYGSNNAFKSTNGGVDWQVFIDEDYAKALQYGGFVHMLTMDATNPQHLIVTPHFECEIGQGPDGLPATKRCLLETTDAGATWKIREGTPGSGEGGAQVMLDADTWFWSLNDQGLFRTSNGGESWDHVYDQGYATNSIVRTESGKFLTGGVFSVLESDDGITWTSVPSSPGLAELAGSGGDIFGARDGHYFSSTDEGATWTELASPDFGVDYTPTWDLAYDADHHLLYSVNSTAGFWRMVTE